MNGPVPTYAKVGGPPADWQRLDVLLGGQRVSDVVEVNTQEGWAVRHVLQDGKPVYDPVAKALVKERVQGNYTLTWRMEE